MIKNKILLMIFLISILFMPRVSYALESNVNLSCEKNTLSAGEQTSCNISVSVSSGSLLAFSGQIELSDNLTLVSATSDDIWEGNGNDGNFELYTDEAKDGNVKIGAVVVKVKPGVAATTELITLTDIILGDEDFNDQNVNDISREIQVSRQLSDNANLESLSVSVGNLSPSFSANVTNYTVDNVDSATINIQATAAANASINGLGIRDLSYGKNTFQIIVTAESGKVKTYSIIVTRENNKSSDSSLKSLEVTGANLEFDSKKLEYRNIILSSDVETFSVKAVANDSKATIKYSSNNDEKLDLGETDTIYIFVTAEDGSTSTYRVTATRKDERSSNNSLKTLTMNGKNINLGSGQSFTTTVDNSVTSAKVEAFAEDEKASVKINGNNNLKVGNNPFEIVVTAENGAIKTYKLTVIRKNSDGDITNLSNNSDLKSLEIENINLAFDKNKLQYNFEVENNVTKLKIKYKLDDSKASATIEGNNSLKVGLNTIKIIVTAENGESSTYVLKVTRKDKNYEVENSTTSIVKALEDKDEYEKVIVKVKTTDNLLIPNNIIKTLINSKKTLTYKVIEGTKEQYSITLDGGLFDSYEKDINYGLTFESDNVAFTQKIGTRKNVILNFEQDGEIPSGTIFNIYVGDEYTDGSNLYLYSYDDQNDELKLINENLSVENGYVNIPFNSLSEFVLLNSKVEDEQPVVTPEPNTNNDNNGLLLYGIGGGIVLILIVIIILILVRKKKNKGETPVKQNDNNVSSVVLETPTPISVPEIGNINFSDDIDLIDIEDVPNNNEFLLGISAMDIDDYLVKCPLADLKNSNIKEGIVIVGFENNSPVEKIGLRQGDVLLEINKQKIANKEHFKNLISNIKHGIEVEFTYYRNGENKQVKVLL